MIGQGELTLDDYKAILRRRVWLLVVPALLCAAGAYTVSFYVPSRYTSETGVLVEQPTVPGDYRKTVVGGHLNQTLPSIREQILTRTRAHQTTDTFTTCHQDPPP